jgi:hypothetical protein
MPAPRKHGPRYPCGQLKYPRKHSKSRRDQSRRNQRDRDVRKRLRAFIEGYKATHPCVNCGESDPLVLEFHHRDQGLKKKDVANIATGNWSIAVLKKEIEKCDVLCANCHRRKTAGERRLLSIGRKTKAPLVEFDQFDLFGDARPRTRAARAGVRPRLGSARSGVNGWQICRRAPRDHGDAAAKTTARVPSTALETQHERRPQRGRYPD